MTRIEAIQWLGDLLMPDSGISDSRAQAIRRAIKVVYQGEPAPVSTDSIRVRIAVAVDAEGNHGVCAVDRIDNEQTAMASATEYFTPIAVGMIEADIPRIPTIQGRVVEATQ